MESLWIRREPLRWESGSSAVAGEILDCWCCCRAVRTGRLRGVCAVVVRRLTNEESFDGATPGLHHRRRSSVAAIVVIGLTNAISASQRRHGRVRGAGAALVACTTTNHAWWRTATAAATTKTRTGSSTSPKPPRYGRWRAWRQHPHRTELPIPVALFRIL
jgi:hypothetical protein